MNFKKKTKKIIAATAVFSTAICICFFAMGAYAVSGNKTTWKGREIQNEVLTEDGVYYIFCDGAEEKDKPQASVTAGNIQFVLVRKGSYTTVGPFPNSETLLEDVVKQCEQMKSLTAAEKELIMKTAAGIGGISSSSCKAANIQNRKLFRPKCGRLQRRTGLNTR